MTPKQTVLEREPQAHVFYDELFHDPEVCSHCFTRIRDVEAIGEIVSGSRLASHPTEHRTLTEMAEMGHDTVGPGSGMTEPTRPQVYCGECGRTAAPSRDRYALSTMMEAAERIYDVLSERGHNLSLEVLRDSVRAAKSKPEFQGLDTEILAWGVGRALRARPAVTGRDTEGAREATTTAEADAPRA